MGSIVDVEKYDQLTPMGGEVREHLMTERPDLAWLYDRHNVPEGGRLLIEAIRNSEPIRRVTDGRSNVTSELPSDKMGVGIQNESRTNERKHHLKFELDPKVKEYWDQPTKLTIRYHNREGKSLSSVHIPDDLVISEEGIFFAEFKTLTDLLTLSEKYPDRFARDAQGRWRSPAGEESAAAYGIGYRVLLPSDVSSIFARNADFILDYLRDFQDPTLDTQIRKTAETVSAIRVIRLDRLIESIRSPDAVYYAIARRLVYFMFEDQLLCRPEVSYVYCSETYAEATRLAIAADKSTPESDVTIEIGAELIWNERHWKIINHGASVYSLVSDDGNISQIKETQFAELVRDCHIKPIPRQLAAQDAAREILLTASPEDIAEGVRKAGILEQFARGVRGGIKESLRTIRQWKQDARDAGVLYGNEFLGLISQVSKRGWSGSHLDEEIVEPALLKSIVEDYLTASPKNVISAFKIYQTRCSANGIPHASYRTYLSRVKQVQLAEREEARHGRKAGYQASGPKNSPVDSEDVLPTHGDRAFELAHADHTELQIDLVSAITGEPLGRPWLSALIDAYTRVVLAYFITFEPPSYRALMMLFRECVRRHGRLPSRCITDQGREFKSIYYEALLLAHHVEPMKRPSGEPRYGSLIEKLNATSQSQFIDTLLGNTANLRIGRSQSATHNPDEHAVWTPDAFDDRLGEWFYQIYPHNKHLGIVDYPAARFERSLATSGNRPVRFIPYDEQFLRETLPAPDVPTRCIRRGVITLNHIPYSGDVLLDSQLWGENVEVRYDPYDISYIYAYVNRRWHRIPTTHHLILEYTERNLRLAHMEVYARCKIANQDYLTVPERVMQFLQDVHNQERHLLGLRKYNQDRAAHDPKEEAQPDISIHAPIAFSDADAIPISTLTRKGAK